jgi:hypothetical protein
VLQNSLTHTVGLHHVYVIMFPFSPHWYDTFLWQNSTLHMITKPSLPCSTRGNIWIYYFKVSQRTTNVMWVEFASFLKFLHHSQLDTHKVGFHWTGDQLVAEATTYTTHTKRTSMFSAAFKPATPEIKRLQTYASDVTDTGISSTKLNRNNTKWNTTCKFYCEYT